MEHSLDEAARHLHAQLLDKTVIVSDVGVSAKVIGTWLNVLQASNQIILLADISRISALPPVSSA